MAKVSNKGNCASPKKAKMPLKRVKKEIPSPSKKGSSGPSINVVGFGEPFTLELYWYEKNQRQDGFIDSLRRYINSAGTRIHDEDALTHSGVDGANFTEITVRRVPRSQDETMYDGEYPRFLIVRYLNGPSTAETRQVGLEALKSFLMDGRFQRYPIANSVPTIDRTYEGAAFDEYVKDDKIKQFMEEDIDPAELDEDFFSTFPDCAKICWKGPYYSEFARTLGFGDP